MLVNEGGEEIAVEGAELGVLWGIWELWFFCEQTNVWAPKMNADGRVKGGGAMRRM